MEEDCCATYVSNISQSYPHFNVNHDYLIVLSSEDDRMKIFHQDILKYTVQPYNPIFDVGNGSEVHIPPISIRSLDVSEDGETIAFKTSINDFYFYSSQDRKIKGYESQSSDYIDKYRKGFTWLSEKSVLINMNTNSYHFFHAHFFRENSFSYDL